MKDVTNSLDTTKKAQVAAPATASAKNSEPLWRRIKTSGEKLFDFSTYVGVGIGLNELIAMKSFNLFAGPWKKGYEWAEAASKKIPVLSKSEYVSGGRFLRVCVALIGGTIALFPQRWMESSKASIVRFFDRHIYGVKAEDDVAITKLHADMEKAPKQTWASLIEGRIVVMATAFGIDYFLGKPDAIITKPFENTVLKDYSSVDRMGATLARKIVDFFDPKGAGERLLARDLAHPYDIQKEVKEGANIIKAGEGKAVANIYNAFYLLTIAVAMTALFYISSKMFAKNIAKKEERKEAISKGEIPPDSEAVNAEKTPEKAEDKQQPSTAKVAEAQAYTATNTAEAPPKTKVSHVAHGEQVAKHAPANAVAAQA